ncbi:unnamed protein product [Auanema sp. JU1783]|nr:unnamed protein product [Auanema sp. JU1783]
MVMTLWSLSGIRLFLIGWILTSITNFPAAYTHTSINTAVIELNKYINESFTDRFRPLQIEEVSLIKSGVNSVWYVGQIGGAIISPIVCDRWGRKVAFIVSVVMMTSALGIQMLASLTPYVEILVTGRIITSIFSPLSDAALMLYLQEISPASLRGTMSSLFSTGYAVMCLFGMVIGHENVLGHSLPLLFFVPLLPGLISFIYLLFLPETPKYLILKRNDKEEAVKALQFFQGSNADETQLLVANHSSNESVKESSIFAIPKLLRERHLMRAFSMSVAVLILTLPFYPVLQSSTFFFTHLHVPNAVAQWSSSLLMVLLTVCCLTSTAIVDKLPRRFMLLTAGTCSILALSLFSLASVLQLKYLAVGAIFTFILSYGLGIGPVAWFICPELVPLQHRSVMFCLCYAVHSCLVVITNFTIIPLFTIIGGLSFIPVYIIPCSLSVLYIYLYLPETKGRENHDIVNQLRGTKQKSTNIPTV